MIVQKFLRLLKPLVYSRINRRSKWSRENAKYFSDIFGLTSDEAKIYRFEKKLHSVTREQLEKKVELFSKIGITTTDWLKYPVLFKESCSILEQQYLQLKEAGFHCIDATLLAHYEKCRRKQIRLLKTYGFLDKQVNVAQNFLSHLNPRQKDFPVDDFTDESIFEDVHHKILTRYLAWRLNTTQDDIQKFYRINSFKSIKSFDHICENCNLLESIGYTSQEILKHGFLLRMNPTHFKAVLEDVPDLAGIDIRTALRSYPKIVGKPPSHYMAIYYILSEAKIPDECIQNYMDIFSLEPELIKLRLDDIKSVPELKVLLNSPGILKLIRCHDEARSRLSFLQDVKFKCLSTSLLSMPQSTFNIQVREGKDVTNIKELAALLKRLLQSTSDTIETNLRKHPYCCNIPLVEVEKSYKYLRYILKFKNGTIEDVIQVVLYPRDKIEEKHYTVLELDLLKGRNVSRLQRLNLILYFLEKDHYFTGNGIWRQNEEHT